MTYPLEQLEPSAPPPLGSPARILADANADAERIREAARAEGYADGVARGRDDGHAEVLAAAETLTAALADAATLRRRLADETEQDAVALAFTLAAKVLAGALHVQPERVLDTVRGALRRVTERRRITVLVDPADLELVSATIGELQNEAGGIEHCEVHSDRRVGRGGAIVRTVECEIDATVQTQLERAREVVQTELGTRDGGDDR
jgi:flagellar assembly protein FliH